MTHTWLLDVLDRELPNLVGSERDRIAHALFEALPRDAIKAAIQHEAETILRGRYSPRDVAQVARCVATEAAEKIAALLQPGAPLAPFDQLRAHLEDLERTVAKRGGRR